MKSVLSIVAAAVVLAAAAPAAAVVPRHGTLVPGRSLGGIRLGESAAGVRTALGRVYGVCRGCRTTTWYFTYGPFVKQGLAVELTRGHVSGLYTLWQPFGWHARNGLRLDAYEAAVAAAVPRSATVECPGYHVLVADTAHARTVYVIDQGRLFGFGLVARGADPCR